VSFVPCCFDKKAKPLTEKGIEILALLLTYTIPSMTLYTDSFMLICPQTIKRCLAIFYPFLVITKPSIGYNYVDPFTGLSKTAVIANTNAKFTIYVALHETLHGFINYVISDDDWKRVVETAKLCLERYHEKYGEKKTKDVLAKHVAKKYKEPIYLKPIRKLFAEMLGLRYFAPFFGEMIVWPLSYHLFQVKTWERDEVMCLMKLRIPVATPEVCPEMHELAREFAEKYNVIPITDELIDEMRKERKGVDESYQALDRLARTGIRKLCIERYKH